MVVLETSFALSLSFYHLSSEKKISLPHLETKEKISKFTLCTRKFQIEATCFALCFYLNSFEPSKVAKFSKLLKYIQFKVLTTFRSQCNSKSTRNIPKSLKRAKFDRDSRDYLDLHVGARDQTRLNVRWNFSPTLTMFDPIYRSVLLG